jgi:acyl-coenzyme A thioesterase PaaI-like protein
VNFLSPAVGEHFRAVASVTRSGRTISVMQGELFAVQHNQEKLVAVMLATMMRVET